MDSAKPVVVTGATGFLGKAVVTHLLKQGRAVDTFDGIDLCDEALTCEALAPYAGHQVIHLAYPGGDGIGDALVHPATIAANLLRMDLNVIEACAEVGVAKLVCIGSVCSYPEVTTLPTDESQLWSGYPETVNASYGIVKRTQLALLQAFRAEHQLNGIHLILPNLYGPGDKTAHVVPALIRRIRAAKASPVGVTPTVLVWGDHAVTRSFLYIDDAADGIVRALDLYDSPEPLNLVAQGEVDMGTLVRLLAMALTYNGAIAFDSTKPTGHRRRAFDDTRMVNALGWQPQWSLNEGLLATVKWHLEQETDV